MANTLLLISDKDVDEKFAAEVAMTAGLSLSTCKTAKEGADIIASSGAAVIFVDGSSEKHYQDFEEAMQSSVGLFSDKINANRIHFISEQDLKSVNYLIHSPVFGHFITRQFEDLKKSGEFYGRLIKASLMERAFGLENFMPPDTKIQIVKFDNTLQKQDAVEAIKNFLIQAKFKSRMATVVANAVDELIMNAMFDAPVDELGRPLYSTVPRATEMELKDRHLVEMHVGFDGEFVAISAVDNFGSLDKVKLLTHISKRYTDEEYKVKMTTAGAGIGLATVFRSGGSFLFTSETRVRTEVTVFFRRMDSFRQFKDQFRFISTQFYF